MSSNSARFWSWLPWLKLSRKTSTPASNSARSRSRLALAGPTVATILTLRRRRPAGPAAPLRLRTRSLSSGAREDEDGAEVIDIGQGRAGHDKIAQYREEAIAVMLRERFVDREPLGSGPRDRVRVHDRPGIVFRAVNPVSVAGQRGDPRRAAEMKRQSKQELAVAAAA